MRFLKAVTKNVTEGRVARVEWYHVTYLVVPTLAFITVIQALLSHSPIQSWQILYAWVSFTLAGLGVLLGQQFKVKFNFAPLLLFMLIFPVIAGDLATQSWVSIGLICMGAAIYFCSITNFPFAIAVSICIAIWQSYVASLNLPSISDNRDINFFHSYFAFTWIISVGIGSILIYRRYLAVSDNVYEIIEDSLNDTVSALQRLRIANIKEASNLKLHGTVLNTLIYLKNLGAGVVTPEKTRELLKADLKSLASTRIANEPQSLDELLQNVIADRSLARIVVSAHPVIGEISDPIILSGTLEIIREQLLNLEKHSPISEVEIQVISRPDQKVEILISAPVAKGLQKSEIKEFLVGPKKSKSLNRILKSYDARYEISFDRKNSVVTHRATLAPVNFEKKLGDSVANARYSGLNDFALNYVRIGAYVGLVALPGYLFTGMRIPEVLLLAVTNIGLVISIEKPDNKYLLYATTLLSFFVMPFLFLDSNKCEDVLQLPWLWNLILVVAFLVTIRESKPYFKWLPVVVLTLESIYYPRLLEFGCRDILNGSIPAIPIITIFAIAVLRVRRREFSIDKSEILQSADEVDAIKSLDQLLSQEFDMVVEDLKKFESTQDFSESKERLSEKYELHIQKIRAYLLAAENFDNQLIRSIYQFVKAKLNKEQLIRLSIVGTVTSDANSKINIELLLQELERLLGRENANLIISNAETLEIFLEFSDPILDEPQEISTIPGVIIQLNNS